MQIISHRGYWKNPDERNQRVAFIRSFNAGFGTETDLRDICGKIVVSHDMSTGKEITFEEVLQLMDGRNLPLALNIKADGQIDEILRLLCKYGHTNYFTFDMSIPDMVVQIQKKARVFSGFSDLLSNPVEQIGYNGIWLDSFRNLWWDADMLDNLMRDYDSVCVVSEELHKREPKGQWKMIKSAKCFKSNNLTLCTDNPEEALRFFGVSK